MSLQDDLDRGLAARQILENPEFRHALDDTRAAILDAIGLTQPGEGERREFLYQSLRTLPFLERALMARLNSGVLAAKELEAEEANPLGI